MPYTLLIGSGVYCVRTWVRVYCIECYSADTRREGKKRRIGSMVSSFVTLDSRQKGLLTSWFACVGVQSEWVRMFFTVIHVRTKSKHTSALIANHSFALFVSANFKTCTFWRCQWLWISLWFFLSFFSFFLYDVAQYCFILIVQLTTRARRQYSRQCRILCIALCQFKWAQRMRSIIVDAWSLCQFAR